MTVTVENTSEDENLDISNNTFDEIEPLFEKVYKIFVGLNKVSGSKKNKYELIKSGKISSIYNDKKLEKLLIDSVRLEEKKIFLDVDFLKNNLSSEQIGLMIRNKTNKEEDKKNQFIKEIKEKLSNIDNIFPNISKIKLQENERYIYLEEKDLYFDSKTGIIFPNLENDFDSYKSQYKWEMMSDEIKKEVFNGATDIQFKTDKRVVYVNINNNNHIKDGKTWETAFSSLDDALGQNPPSWLYPRGFNTSDNPVIFVATGNYDADNLFIYIPYGIQIYGGFFGNEDKLWKRNIQNNKVIIKGILKSDNNTLQHRISGITIAGEIRLENNSNALIFDSHLNLYNNSNSKCLVHNSKIEEYFTKERADTTIIKSEIGSVGRIEFINSDYSSNNKLYSSEAIGKISSTSRLNYITEEQMPYDVRVLIKNEIPYFKVSESQSNWYESFLSFTKSGLLNSIFNDKKINSNLLNKLKLLNNDICIDYDSFLEELNEESIQFIAKTFGIELEVDNLNTKSVNEAVFDLEGLTKEEFIIKAIKNEDIEKVKYVIKIGANVNFNLNNPNEEDKETLLIYAIKTTKNIEIIKLLIEKITNVDEVGGYYRDTPLITAINEGQFEIAHVLIEKGADIKIKNKSQEDALFRATSRNNLGIIELLIKKGADINTKNGYLETPLMNAAAYGQLDVVKLLLSKGADVNLINDSKTNVLFKACICANVDRTNEKMTSIFKTLLENGADYTIRDRIQATVLYEAYCSCPLEVINLLINKGLKIHQTDVNGNGPIFQAARNEDSRVLEFLLKNGYNPNEIDSLGNTALFKAVNLRRVENIKLLVKHGANVNYSVRGKTVFDEINAMNPAIKEKVLEALKR